MLWGGGAVALVVLVVVVAIVLNAKSDRDARQRAADARAVAAERVRLTKLQAPHRGAAPALRPAAGATDQERLAARAALVKTVEGAITRDAQARVRAGQIDGPIRGSQCGPFLRAPDAVPDDRVLSKRVGRYDCVAVRNDIKGDSGSSVGSIGYPFVAALDFRRFTYVWCRNTPAQSERGEALAFVRLDRACLAAKGRPSARATWTSRARSPAPTRQRFLRRAAFAALAFARACCLLRCLCRCGASAGSVIGPAWRTAWPPARASP